MGLFFRLTSTAIDNTYSVWPSLRIIPIIIKAERLTEIQPGSPTSRLANQPREWTLNI